MKRIILVFGLAVAAVNSSSAQANSQAGRTVAQNADAKRLFLSKTEEFAAHASRNSEAMAKKTAQELMSMMQENTRLTSATMAKTTDNTSKQTLNKKRQEQLAIMASVKQKLSEPVKNANSMVREFKAFQKTL